MKRYTILVIAILSIISLNAQEITLKQAIDKAMKLNTSIKQKEVSLEISRLDRRLAAYEYLPTLEGESGMRRNFDIKATPVPARMFDPSIKTNELTYAKFGTRYGGSLGLKLDYKLFSPDRLGNLKMKNNEERVAEINIQEDKAMLLANIRLDYLATLLADYQLKLSVADTVCFRSIYDYVRLRNEKGQSSDDELLSSQQDLNSSLVRYNNALSLKNKSKQSFLVDMGEMPTKENMNKIILVDSITAILSELEAESRRSFVSYEEEKDKLNISNSLISVNNAWLNLLPTISLEGYWGTNYHNQELKISDKNYWYANSYIGVKVSMPLTKLISKANTIKKERATLKLKTLENSEKMIRRIAKVNEQRMNMTNASRVMRLTKNNADIAERRYKAAEEMFRLGQTYPAKLKVATRDLLAAEVSYIQAIYDYCVAATNLILAKQNQ